MFWILTSGYFCYFFHKLSLVASYAFITIKVTFLILGTLCAKLLLPFNDDSFEMLHMFLSFSQFIYNPQLVTFPRYELTHVYIYVVLYVRHCSYSCIPFFLNLCIGLCPDVLRLSFVCLGYLVILTYSFTIAHISKKTNIMWRGI